MCEPGDSRTYQLLYKSRSILLYSFIGCITILEDNAMKKKMPKMKFWLTLKINGIVIDWSQEDSSVLWNLMTLMILDNGYGYYCHKLRLGK